MSNPRFRLLSMILMCTAVAAGAIGAYFLLVRNNVTVGAVLLVVAISDLVLALVFSRRA